MTNEHETLPELAAIVAAGVDAGLWKVTRQGYRAAKLETEGGRAWSLSVHRGEATLSPGSLEGPGGRDLFPRDLAVYPRLPLPQASGNAKRDPLALARSLFKRVCATPEGQAFADAMQAWRAQEFERRAALERHAAALAAAGCSVHPLEAWETWQARFTAHGGRVFGHVSAEGEVSAEVRAGLDAFRAVLGVLA